MTVKKRPCGRWLSDVQPIRGKRYRKLFKTKAEALRYESHILSAHADNPDWSIKPVDRRRLAYLLSLWYDLHGHTLRDGKRRYSKLSALIKRLKNPIANKPDIQLYLHDRRIRLEAGIAPKTLNNELGYLKAVYNELISAQVVDYQNPYQSVKALRIAERELSFLTNKQINELIASIRKATENPHVEPIVLVCLATGARWSEAERLSPGSLQNGVVTFTGTKSGKVRSVPIPDSLRDYLLNHWQQFGPFTGSITSFRRALARTTIQLPRGQASHVLRHTFASHFIMNGGDILTLQRILGHSSVVMTMRYAHLSPGHLRDALKLSPLNFCDTFGTLSAENH